MKGESTYLKGAEIEVSAPGVDSDNASLFSDTVSDSFLREEGFLGHGIIPNVSTAQNEILDVAQRSQWRAQNPFSLCVCFLNHTEIICH